VDLAEKRQHVVLAHAEHLDVLDDHHLVVIDGEECVVDDVGGLLGVAVGEVLHGLDDALRGVEEAFARGSSPMRRIISRMRSSKVAWRRAADSCCSDWLVGLTMGTAFIISLFRAQWAVDEPPRIRRNC